jgi:glyoxylase-like metal-dependent hydrolase (beta-lactamase superfamily II)
MECVYAWKNSSQKRDSEGTPAKPKTKPAANCKIRPFNVDLKISGAQTDIRLGGRIIQALHTPGHSPGSMAYLTESEEKKILFGRDIHGLIYPDLKSDVGDYQRFFKIDAGFGGRNFM